MRTLFTPSLLLVFALLVLVGCQSGKPNTSSKAPNVIVFYVDDLGYGDVGVYGAQGVKTPAIDNIAQQGMKFTDAHSSAATCTPSRYSLLTGEHGFRGNASILKGDAPALIRPNQATLPKLLRKAGYRTGVVGKWHLGLGDGNLDWNKHITPGPQDIGFDYSFLLPATGDRVPTVYVEDGYVVDHDQTDPILVSYKDKVGSRPTRYEQPELARFVADRQHSDTIINGVSRIGTMAGGESALWVDEEFPDVFTDKALAFIRSSKDQPFFLFHSYHDIHVPRLPHPRFQGKSSMGPRGDAIVQMDWMTGKIIEELHTLNIADNTLVIFTSDNGPVLTDGYDDMAVEMLGQHKPAGPFRGGKYSAFEAGTRVPFIAYWPGTIAPGESDALLSQMDIYATVAALAKVPLIDGEAQDSIENWSAFQGQASQREELIEEAVATKALRIGQWKYIHPISKAGKGAFTVDKNIEGGFSLAPQLYDLATDIGETNDIANQHPGRVAAMASRLATIVDSGYQTQTK